MSQHKKQIRRKPLQFGEGVRWEQGLVDAQVSVNRACFEMNKPGDWPPGVIDEAYVLDCIEDAMECLEWAKSKLVPQKKLPGVASHD